LIEIIEISTVSRYSFLKSKDWIFKLDDILKAYDTFGHAAETRALKVLIEMN
jgi:threonine dehydrogenase-like Zn-dependent dehydrogenase